MHVILFTFEIKLVFSDNTDGYSDCGNYLADGNLNSVDAHLASNDFREGSIINYII